MSGVSGGACPWELVSFDASKQYKSVERTVYDLDGKPVTVSQKGTDENGNETTVLVEQRIKVTMARDQYVMTIKRIMWALTAFGEEVGNTRRTWNLVTGPGTSINYGSTNKKYVCTSDQLEMVDPYSGEIRQTQSWLYLSDWEDVPEGQFE